MKLSPADEAWVRMDRAESRMVITAVLITGEPLTQDQVTRLIRERLLTHPRFRAALLAGVDEAGVDLAYHLGTAQLGTGDEAGLQTLIGQLMPQSLDPSRPLWRVWLVERYGEGSALIWRMHHALADGVSLLRVLLGLADDPPRGEELRLPMHGRGALRGPRLLMKGVIALGRLLGLPKDHPSPLRGPLDGRKNVAWTPPLSLDRVKAIAHREGATVNDVLTSALAGALHRWLAERGEVPSSIRALIPFDLRAGATDERMGNRFGLVYLPLPVGPMEPRRRLSEVSRRMRKLKDTPEALVAFRILEVIGRVWRGLAPLAIRLFGRKASLVLTNLAGPRVPLHFMGAPLSELVFWVPQAAGIGLGISMFSYDGRVRIGIAADRARMSNPQSLADGIVRELDALAGETEVLPAPSPQLDRDQPTLR
jgi:hypothetical protein